MKTNLDQPSTRRIAHPEHTTTNAATPTPHATTNARENEFAHANGSLNEAQRERKATKAKLEEAVGTGAVFALNNVAAGLELLASFEPGKVAFGVAGTRAPDPGLGKAMEHVVRASQALADASSALKLTSSSAAKSKFDKACAKLDDAKAAMLDAILRQPRDERRILALDTVDAVEVGHNKPAATTKLGYAVDALTKGKVGDTLKRALKLSDDEFAHARDVALRASEWTTLGELVMPSSTFASPGFPSGAERAQIVAVPHESARLAQQLGLVDAETADAIANHLEYRGRASSPAAQILGVVRMLSSLAEPRLFRDKALLSVNDSLNALMQNARSPEPKVDAALVSLLQPVLADAVATLRT